jgi:hypothetical protein
MALYDFILWWVTPRKIIFLHNIFIPLSVIDWIIAKNREETGSQQSFIFRYSPEPSRYRFPEKKGGGNKKAVFSAR